MAAFVELTIEQGASFSTTINVTDAYGAAVNLTNYTANSQLRKSYYSTTAVDFDTSITSETSGEITIAITAANTSSLTPGRYVYDVIMESPGGVVSRIFEGIATVMPSVTR